MCVPKTKTIILHNTHKGRYMSGKIFVLNTKNQLVSLNETPYDNEDLLQKLLADHPELLAPDEIGDEPRRWLLLLREAAVPDTDDSAGRWWVDHLFVDQDGIPTLVEVKRSTDTRIRREVVGQLLDYAAHAVDHWQIPELRARFEARLTEEDPDTALEMALGVESADVFWQEVDDNLRIGRIRLLFVADDIPRELQRVVSFLNKQMNPAEVLAIALRQYTGEDLRTLVPTVYGQVPQAQKKQSRAQGRQWDEESFFEAITDRKGEAIAGVARTIFDWINQQADDGFSIWWGKGAQDGSFIPILTVAGQNHNSIGVWTYGTIEVQFQYMLNQPPFTSDDMRQDFMNWLNLIDGVDLPEDSLTRRPAISLEHLADEAALQQFLGVLKWFVDTVHEYHA